MSAYKRNETHRLNSIQMGRNAAAVFHERKRTWSAEEIEPLEFDNSPNQGDLILSGSFGQVLSFGSGYDD